MERDWNAAPEHPDGHGSRDSDLGLLLLGALVILLLLSGGGGLFFFISRRAIMQERQAREAAEEAMAQSERLRAQAERLEQEAKEAVKNADLGEPATVAPARTYAPVAEALERFIAHELEDKRLPALSIALVDDQSIVWAAGFGFVDTKKKVPATAQTVYRVGSVSKLFTDIAVMQLVEQGKLDLDAPITKYLPDFQPKNPFQKPITLRHLMAHHSGLVREPPAGHYFDPTEPTLAETVKSLNRTELVYAPESKTKYSNAGIAVVGYVLERTQKEPFTKYLKGAVLDPLGLKRSGFESTPELKKNLAAGLMWTLDGRTFDAPTFELGTSPAGSLYATVSDLGKFLRALFAGDGLLKRESLEQMWKPQFAKPSDEIKYGLGFSIGDLEGHRRIGHGGGVYGFSTEMAGLPDDKLGVVVITFPDVTKRVTKDIAKEALKP